MASTGDGHRRVEAEGLVRLLDVVVDGLGDAHHRHAELAQAVGDGQGAVAADAGQRVQAQRADDVHRLLAAIHGGALLALADVPGEGVGRVAGAQDGAALHEQAGDVVRGQLAVLARDQALVAVQEADHVPAVVAGGRAHDGADHRVEAGGVAAAREQTDRVDAVAHAVAFRWSPP